MTDIIKGEVLIPQSRFIPKCGHTEPQLISWIEYRGDEASAIIQVKCADCGSRYEQELPYGVPGIPSGNRTV